MIRALVDAAARSGVPKQELLRRAEIDEKELDDPFGRFEFDEYEAVYSLALDMTRDEALGLHVIEHCSEAAFDLLPHLLAVAPTPREGFKLCAQFGSLLVSGSHVAIQETADVARIRYSFRRLSPRVDQMHAELSMLGLSRLFHILAGPSAPIDRVSFEHPAPDHRREYQRLFGDSVRFGQPFTGIEFARTLLDVPHRHHQPATYSALRAEAHRQLESQGADPGQVERVRQYLLAQPASRVPKMHVAAGALGMSVRSLRRRLLAEGISYRELVHARLEEAAAHVLRSPGSSVQDAARVTGFSDIAAFHRAFKKWTGVTPTEFRRGPFDAFGQNRALQ